MRIDEDTGGLRRLFAMAVSILTDTIPAGAFVSTAVALALPAYPFSPYSHHANTN
jgi:hypothetical protein